jgi:hypothetical protein
VNFPAALAASTLLAALLLVPAVGGAVTRSNNGPQVATTPARPPIHCKRGEGRVLLKLKNGRKVWRCLKVD